MSENSYKVGGCSKATFDRLVSEHKLVTRKVYYVADRNTTESGLLDTDETGALYIATSDRTYMSVSDDRLLARINAEIARATTEELAIRAEIERISQKDERGQRWSYVSISGNYEVKPAIEQYLDVYVKIAADYTVIYINTDDLQLERTIVLRVANPDGYKFRVRSGTYQDWREILGIERNMTKGEVETVFALKVLSDKRLQLISISDIPDSELEMENIFDTTFEGTFD